MTDTLLSEHRGRAGTSEELNNWNHSNFCSDLELFTSERRVQSLLNFQGFRSGFTWKSGSTCCYSSPPLCRYWPVFTTGLTSWMRVPWINRKKQAKKDEGTHWHTFLSNYPTFKNLWKFKWRFKYVRHFRFSNKGHLKPVYMWNFSKKKVVAFQ